MAKKKLVFGIGVKDEHLVTTVFVDGKSKMCPYKENVVFDTSVSLSFCLFLPDFPSIASSCLGLPAMES